MSSPATAPTDLEAIAETFQKLASINHRVNINAVVSLTWITYDIITCFDKEVALIWKTRWTIPKLLYVALRYYAPLWLMYETIIHLTPGNKLSTLSCQTFPSLQAVGPVILGILVDMIMVLRIRALYRDKKSITYTVLFVGLATISVMIPVSIYCVRLSRPVPAPPPFNAIAGCLVLSAIDWSKLGNAKAPVISFVILNAVYLCLTLHKFLENVRELKSVNFGSMYMIFIGEGVAYFIGCIAINAVDIAVSSSPELFPFLDLIEFWLVAYYSYTGCHLVLHLRSVNSSLSSLSSFTDCADLEARFKATPPPSYNSSSISIRNLKAAGPSLGIFRVFGRT